MRVSISNIAWERSEDESVSSVLQEMGIALVDIVPGKYFANPEAYDSNAISPIRDWWTSRGITLSGMQALLFGTTGLNLFGDDGRMLQHLKAVCKLAGALGIRPITFGSPRNRDRRDLTTAQAVKEAVGFFRRVGDHALTFGVELCLEPNPPSYGCNFMTTTAETAEVVALADHPAVRLQLDTGAMAMNQEDPGQTVKQYHSLIGHVHASEPNLVPLGAGEVDHDAVAEALTRYLPETVVTIEMRSINIHPRDWLPGPIQLARAKYGRS
jgi:sugar phosphate isomerase/epimerase